jgi:hypothetical protein
LEKVPLAPFQNDHFIGAFGTCVGVATQGSLFGSYMEPGYSMRSYQKSVHGGLLGKVPPCTPSKRSLKIVPSALVRVSRPRGAFLEKAPREPLENWTDSPRFERGSPGPKPGRMSWLPHESISGLRYSTHVLKLSYLPTPKNTDGTCYRRRAIINRARISFNNIYI